MSLIRKDGGFLVSGRVWPPRQKAYARTMAPAIGRLPIFVLDCPEPGALAHFYAGLLGWSPSYESDEWTQLVSEGIVALAFRRVEGYRAPTWPTQEVPQQVHLDVAVEDLDDAGERVLALGATLAEFQPDPVAYRVYLDPAGHPFCLVLA